ncbi:MAG: hypothetical protein ACPIG6_06300 [Akkermansiaceae bacterium]
MAQKILAIGGEPATGKSTMVKRLIKQLLPLRTFSYGLIKGLYCPDRELYIPGIYDNSIFCGTDKLSMAAQPDFIKLTNKIKGGNFLFEGDRLFNQSLFDAIKCDIYVLTATQETLQKRHKTRKDAQSAKFLKAKKTKIKNIISKNQVTIMPNNTQTENEICFRILAAELDRFPIK